MGFIIEHFRGVPPPSSALHTNNDLPLPLRKFCRQMNGPVPAPRCSKHTGAPLFYVEANGSENMATEALQYVIPPQQTFLKAALLWNKDSSEMLSISHGI
jgi:hypothetical protein